MTGPPINRTSGERQKLLADAIRDARMWAAHKVVDADPASEAKEARVRAAQAEKDPASGHGLRAGFPGPGFDAFGR